jgi:hypothetical protein
MNTIGDMSTRAFRVVYGGAGTCFRWIYGCAETWFQVASVAGIMVSPFVCGVEVIWPGLISAGFPRGYIANIAVPVSVVGAFVMYLVRSARFQEHIAEAPDAQVLRMNHSEKNERAGYMLLLLALGLSMRYRSV